MDLEDKGNISKLETSYWKTPIFIYIIFVIILITEESHGEINKIDFDVFYYNHIVSSLSYTKMDF